jgi:hypothetical protein
MAFNFDPQAGLHGNPLQEVEERMRERELAAFGGDVELLLKAGADNIADHSMTDQYLVRLGTNLVLAAAA